MMASQCTEQAVQEFLVERGGRVPQMELIDHFSSTCGENDPLKEKVDREVLKRIVDIVGTVKVENGVIFVCLNSECRAESVMHADVENHDHAECNGNIQERPDNRVNGNPDNGDQTGERYNDDLTPSASFVHDLFIYSLSFDLVLTLLYSYTS